MKPYKEVKEIVFKLNSLEELKELLQNVLTDVNTVIERGTSWIEEVNNLTYLEIKQFLTTETSELIQRCFRIANDRNQQLSEPILTKTQVSEIPEIESLQALCYTYQVDKEYQNVLTKMDEITTSVTTHSEIFQTVQQKLEDLEMLNKILSKQTTEANNKHEEIVEELHSASNFMSLLQTELNETKEKDNLQDEKIQELCNKLQECLEKGSLLEQNQVKSLQEEIKRLTDELAHSNEMISTRELEISSFKMEEGKASSTLEGYKRKLFVIKQAIGTIKFCDVNYSCNYCYTNKTGYHSYNTGTVYEDKEWIFTIKRLCLDCWKNDVAKHFQ